MLATMEGTEKFESPGSEEKGRGKRKRKSTLCPRRDEPDNSDDDDDELYDPLHEVRKCRKTGNSVKKSRINGSIQKNKRNDSIGGGSDPVPGFVDDPRNCETPISVTRKSFINNNASLSPRNGRQVTLLPPLSLQASVENGIDGRNSALNCSKEDSGDVASNASDIQPLRPGHDKELELEVTNENGEVEIVTIVDLHSSSDESDLLAMNGEDEIIPLSDNESCTFSVDHDLQPDVAVDPAESPFSADPVVSHCPPGLDVDSNMKQNSLDADPAANSKTESLAETRKSISVRKKKRKRARDDFHQFDSDAEDNDKVNRLKKAYGLPRPSKAVKTNQVHNNCERPTAPSSDGPYVHVVGPRDAPTSCKVVNVKDVDLDAPTKSKKNRLLVEAFCVPSSVRLFDSVPWLCVFCGNGSAHSNLGDLFGPYHPQTAKFESTDETQASPEAKNASTAGKVARSPRRHSYRLSTGSCDLSHEGGSTSSRPALPQELWVHESCAVWTGGIYVAGGKIQGLEEAASIASQVCCFGCHKMGATLGCFMKGCCQNYHFLCAVKSGCFFQEDNFSILCPRHRDRGKKSKCTGECD